MTWLLNPHAAALLRGWATALSPTPTTLSTPNGRARQPSTCGRCWWANSSYPHETLRTPVPPVDRRTLDAIPDATNRNLIRQYVAWKHNPRIRGLAQEGKATSAAIANARQSVTVATQFLAWMTSNGLELKHATQLDIDSWLAPGPSTRHRARDFVQWAVAARHATNITVPAPPRRDAGTIDHDERLAWIRRCLTDTRIPTYLRVVILLTLLYGQPWCASSHCPAPQSSGTMTGLPTLHPFPCTRPPPFAALLLHQRDHHSPTGSSPDVDSPGCFLAAAPDSTSPQAGPPGNEKERTAAVPNPKRGPTRPCQSPAPSSPKPSASPTTPCTDTRPSSPRNGSSTPPPSSAPATPTPPPDE